MNKEWVLTVTICSVIYCIGEGIRIQRVADNSLKHMTRPQLKSLEVTEINSNGIFYRHEIWKGYILNGIRCSAFLISPAGVSPQHEGNFHPLLESISNGKMSKLHSVTSFQWIHYEFLLSFSIHSHLSWYFPSVNDGYGQNRRDGGDHPVRNEQKQNWPWADSCFWAKPLILWKTH